MEQGEEEVLGFIPISIASQKRLEQGEEEVETYFDTKGKAFAVSREIIPQFGLKAS